MSLRYKFQHLFYKGDINKRRLYKILQDLDSANTGETTDITALKTLVGGNDSGLVKDVADIKTALGKATGEGASGILKDINDIKVAIGDESTEGTILYRLKELEKE